MDYVTISNRHFSEEFGDMTEATSKDKHRPLKRGCMLKRYTDDLEHSWVVKFLQDLRGRWQGQETSLDQLDSFMNADSTNTSFVLENIEDSRDCSWRDKDSWRDKEKSYPIAHFIYRKGEDWDLCKDLFYTVTQLLDDAFPTLSSRSELTESAINDLSQGKAKSSLPSLDETSSEDEIAGVEADIVHLLLTELWIASRDLQFTSVPENGADSGRRGQHGGQEGSGKKLGAYNRFNRARNARVYCLALPNRMGKMMTATRKNQIAEGLVDEVPGCRMNLAVRSSSTIRKSMVDVADVVSTLTEMSVIY